MASPKYSHHLVGNLHLDAQPLSDTEEETFSDPATSIAFPTTLRIPSKTPLPTFTLIGVGVRTVSFLGIKVYSVGFYADLTSPNLTIPKSASPEEKIEHLVRNGACVLRIVPTRSTSYSHLRDGFVRAMQARMQLCRKQGDGLSPPLKNGKALRATARTTNFAVILFGAGLSVVLIYALTSELFSKNSPTVLYGKACELIKASPKATKYLGEPLVFHNQPPSTVRPRHRNHYVSSQLFRDSAGREHMLMNFYVQGHRPGSEPPSTSESESYLSSAFRRAKESVSALADMSLDDIVQSAKEHADNVFEAARQRFRFLSGDAVPPLPLPAAPKEDVKEKKKEGGWMSGFTGLFSGIKGVARTAAQSDSSDGQLYSEGEVHADLVMNDQGYFEFRYLLIDIPNSNTKTLGGYLSNGQTVCGRLNL
ncbi:Mitochondrial import inner membrane translocase subunit tim21 [Grifola frondosa]|uniref:Mitochondrial import inner membrane translocase subunit TIM21 n=1 Tax=Grifola frondosa TaxID=5627 RepID=A0A1C7MS67_GRIFR|nr:Mitochondrial import inner membrane translocase subunit tim21 [Grifola frondosa]